MDAPDLVRGRDCAARRHRARRTVAIGDAGCELVVAIDKTGEHLELAVLVRALRRAFTETLNALRGIRADARVRRAVELGAVVVEEARATRARVCWTAVATLRRARVAA